MIIITHVLLPILIALVVFEGYRTLRSLLREDGELYARFIYPKKYNKNLFNAYVHDSFELASAKNKKVQFLTFKQFSKMFLKFVKDRMQYAYYYEEHDAICTIHQDRMDVVDLISPRAMGIILEQKIAIMKRVQDYEKLHLFLNVYYSNTELLKEMCLQVVEKTGESNNETSTVKCDN